MGMVKYKKRILTETDRKVKEFRRSILRQKISQQRMEEYPRWFLLSLDWVTYNTSKSIDYNEEAKQILRLWIAGLTYQEIENSIGAGRGKSVSTIKNWKRNIDRGDYDYHNPD